MQINFYNSYRKKSLEGSKRVTVVSGNCTIQDSFSTDIYIYVNLTKRLALIM